MSYQINKTDGTLLVDLADGQLDSNSTDLSLIGRNYRGFGEAFNENFIALLENFANQSAPVNPLRGQIPKAFCRISRTTLTVARLGQAAALKILAPLPRSPGAPEFSR